MPVRPDRAASEDAAKDAALRMLGRAPRTEREIRDRLLTRGFVPNAVEGALERLRRVSLLDDGHIYHVQNRGLASNMNFAQYIRLARRHYHEHLYAEHLARKYADLGPYGGTLFNLIRKLKFRTNVGKKNEKTKTAGEMFWQFPMSIDLDSQQHRDVMASLFEHVDEMQWLERKAKFSKGLWLPAANEKMNGGYNGTTEDAFFKVLMREISLDDNEYFKDREDTYAVADVDAGQD